MRGLKWSLIAAVLAGSLGTSHSMLASRAEMSGDEILKQSARAYAALNSYRGTTSAQATYVFQDGTRVAVSGTASIVFTRPDRIQIEGKDSFGNTYRIVSDGKRTTVSDGRPNSEPETLPNVELAIARKTGTANSAPTHVPALLMNLKWGHPYAEAKQSRLVGRERIGGKETYRVVSPTAVVTRTYWVDVESFLLRQMKEEQTTQQLAAVADPGKGREVVYSFMIDAAVAAPETQPMPGDDGGEKPAR